MPPKKKGPGKTKADDQGDAPAPTKASKAETTKPAAAAERRRPVDREVPSREKYEVVGDYDCTLNQTNVGANNNKYYIIQVLKSRDGDQYFAWNRWGRVGEPGQNAFIPCGTLAAAVSSFEKKFKDKTVNAWANRDKFVKKDGKYGLVEKEIEEGDGGSGEAAAPMGKLSRSQIEKGQKVLEELSAVIDGGKKNKSADIERLSSQFFTLIPTNFGRQKPVPITTMDMVNEKDAQLKFFLRMGFEEVETKDDGRIPLAGINELPLPKTLLESIAGACPSSAVTSSVKKGEACEKKKAGGPKRPMTKDEYGSILLYTSNAIYRELNRVLREEDKAGIKKYIRYLRLLLHAADGLPAKPVQLYRGLGVDLSKQYKVGQTITWWGVSSCTSDMQVAKNFAHGCSGESTLVTLDTKTACDISAISFYANEKESLLMPGTQLKVKSVEKKGKVANIRLEEVGRAV